MEDFKSLCCKNYLLIYFIECTLADCERDIYIYIHCNYFHYYCKVAFIFRFKKEKKLVECIKIIIGYRKVEIHANCRKTSHEGTITISYLHKKTCFLSMNQLTVYASYAPTYYLLEIVICTLFSSIVFYMWRFKTARFVYDAPDRLLNIWCQCTSKSWQPCMHHKILSQILLCVIWRGFLMKIFF